MGISYFQRSKLAHVLGISKETLRYYEDKNIVSPKRDPGNAYRVYDSIDCQNLIYLRMLRAYGFSIEDSVNGGVFPGSVKMEGALAERIADNERQLRRLKREQQALEELLDISRRSREEPGLIVVEEAEEKVFFLEQLQGWDPLVNEERNQAVRVLTSELPVSFYGMTIDRNFAEGAQADDSGCCDSSGIFWRESDLDILPDEVRSICCDREYRWSKIWRCVYSCPKGGTTDTEECDYFFQIRKVVQRIRDSGHRLAGDVVVRLLPISINEQNTCLELIFPVEKQ